jgi:hypothetical protein
LRARDNFPRLTRTPLGTRKTLWSLRERDTTSFHSEVRPSENDSVRGCRRWGEQGSCICPGRKRECCGWAPNDDLSKVTVVLYTAAGQNNCQCGDRPTDARWFGVRAFSLQAIVHGADKRKEQKRAPNAPWRGSALEYGRRPGAVTGPEPALFRVEFRPHSRPESRPATHACGGAPISACLCGPMPLPCIASVRIAQNQDGDLRRAGSADSSDGEVIQQRAGTRIAAIAGKDTQRRRRPGRGPAKRRPSPAAG